MMYVLIVIAVIGVVVYACLKKKRGDTEKPQDEKPDDNGGHTEITIKVPIGSKGCIVKDGIKEEVTIRYMPQGLQVFGQDGTLLVDMNNRISKVVGHLKITSYAGRFSVNGGRPWFVIVENPEAYQLVRQHGDDYYTPRIYIEGNDIVWDEIVNKNAEIIYGVY
jgi:hypothetical protein